ncbi:MAG: helix-turn-helix transcriptional regulator [Candidatus Puniceispirillum sp.]
MRYELGQFYITVDKLVSKFCRMYDIDEKVFRQEVADITARKTAHNSEDDEYNAQSMLDGVWTVIAAKSKGYEFAILAGSKMAVAPPIPFNFLKNYPPDLRSVFQRAPYFAKCLSVSDIQYHETSDSVSLSIAGHQTEHGTLLQIVSFFAFLIKMARTQTSAPFIAQKLTLTTNHKNCAMLSKFMGCDIERGSTNSIHVHKSESLIPFVGADNVMWMEAEGELQRRSSGGVNSALYEEVQNILMDTLSVGNGTVDPVIERLGISKRTLQRRLKKDGLSFRQVLDDTRFRLANDFLRQGKISKTEIAYRLGYRDPNSFYRVYKEWAKSRLADD